MEIEQRMILSKKLIRLMGGEIINCFYPKCFRKSNILLMDEPGSCFFDLKSIATLETMMKSYAGTIIFVSHDKQLVDNIADIILQC